MNVFNKIEEIRRKPEYIRLRWAWGLTAMGTFLIIIIWMISFASQIDNSKEKEVLVNSEAMRQLSVQKKSIEDTAVQMKNVLGNQTQDNSSE